MRLKEKPSCLWLIASYGLGWIHVERFFSVIIIACGE